MLRDADLKVFLKASQAVRVKRILRREGGDPATVAAFTEYRDEQDRERYIKIYNIDNDQYGFADLIIKTDGLDPSAIADIIVQEAKARISK
jgi:cytidylate kinase